jgi:hypothetical protein
MLRAMGITVGVIGTAGIIVTAAQALGYIVKWFQW